MSDLRKSLIHLAHSKPELRPHLLPLLKTATWHFPTWEKAHVYAQAQANKMNMSMGIEKGGYDGGFNVFMLPRPENRSGHELRAEVVDPMHHGPSYHKAASRSLSEIADEIRANWKPVFFGAVPYLDAMSSMDSIHDNYGYDSGKSIVVYFLSNARNWRGPVAAKIKAELKAMAR